VIIYKAFTSRTPGQPYRQKAEMSWKYSCSKLRTIVQ